MGPFIVASLPWLILAFICWVLAVLLNPLARFRLRKVPGPTPWPLFGNLLELSKRGEAFALADWKATYGNIFKVWIGPTPMWIVSDPDMSSGPHYRKLKGAWTPLFLPASLQNYCTLMDGAACNLAASLLPHAGAAEMNIVPAFEAHVLQIVVSAAFGVDLHLQAGDPLRTAGSEHDKLMHAVKDVLETAGSAKPWATPMILFPALQPLFRFLLHKFPDAATIRLKQARRRLSNFVYGLIHEERPAAAQDKAPAMGSARRTGVKPGSFLSLLISHSQHNVQLTDEEIFVQAYFFIMAGFHTSSGALSYTMYHLAGHPDKLKAAHEEIDAMGAEFKPTLQTLGSFPYLEACLRESLRLLPPVPATQRYARDRMALGPFNVAPGDMLCAATYNLHHDVGLWEKPFDFTPERFMDTAEVGIKRGSLNTFGEGMRSCIGQNFAIMEIKITLIRLLQAYTFTLAPNQVPLAVKARSSPSLLSPSKGIYINIVSR
ncbi:hypothetical protein WJX74_001193 [Apatococcus lobatus]|uniref:Cytochrome P450 n=1 Tax=Apatococcus lobatus TaxID=904363 RepID=A0AAW1RPE9_9CHLO